MDKQFEKQFHVKDQTIIAFYKENPNLDFLTMNHIFIDILKKLSTNLNETLTNNINAKILSTLTELKTDVLSQINQSKNEYIENVKLVLTNNSLTNNEKMQHILDKSNESIVSKTTSQIYESMMNLQGSINQETNKLVQNINKDEKTITDFIENIDTKFESLSNKLQQPIFNYLQSSEERTSSNLIQLRDKLTTQQTSQESLQGEINEFLNKYKYNSSSKGNISETQLYSILQFIFPSDEIINCSGETATCDYRVNRFNKLKPTILFENKDYTRSVSTEEIKKFERDLKRQGFHGIFISQKSNITYKELFQIDIINNLIHIYIPNANYDIDKIKVAVDIIDNLSSKLVKNAYEETSFNLTKEDLDELLEAYEEFDAQKKSIVEFSKITNKQLIEKIEAMQMNSVKKLLNKNSIFHLDEDFKCKFCNSFNGKNKASLGAHTRTCKSNPNCK